MNVKLQQLIADWRQIIDKVLDLKRVPCPEVQSLLKETYKLLMLFCKKELVPKDISRLFLEMESFLYFAFLMEDKEVEGDFYLYRKVFAVIKALKDGFFDGKYECDFPRLQIADDDENLSVFDFEADCLQDIAI